MKLPPEQEQALVKLLTAVEPADTIEGLRWDSVGIIEDEMQCKRDDAKIILDNFEKRRLVESAITPRGGALSTSVKMPVGRLHWIVPMA